MSKSFSDVEYAKQDADTILVVDALNFAFRWKHKKAKNFAADYVRQINSLATSFGATKILICADKGKSSYRKGLYPEYKANREEKYKDQSDEERDEFMEFLEDYEATLSLLQESYPILRYQGVEADDVIAYICQKKRPETKVWIISSDKDLNQLVSPTVSRWTYVSAKVKEITWDSFEEAAGCSFDDFVSVKVLQGDSGDNVPGVPGVGIKRAVSLIGQYGSAYDIYDNLPLSGNQVYIKNLNEFGDQILLNYELMDLEFSAEALGEENRQAVLEVMEQYEI